jgi:hypothetical protein
MQKNILSKEEMERNFGFANFNPNELWYGIYPTDPFPPAPLGLTRAFGGGRYDPDESCDSSLESKLKELSNETKNVKVDHSRQKLPIFGPCAIC